MCLRLARGKLKEKTLQYRIIASVSMGLLIMSAGIQPAFAYLDPGSGSVLLQVILGGLAGLAVGAKLFWRHIVSLLTFWRRGGD